MSSVGPFVWSGMVTDSYGKQMDFMDRVKKASKKIVTLETLSHLAQ